MIFQKNQIKKVSNYYKINGFVIIKNFFSNNMIINIRKQVLKNIQQNQNKFFYYENNKNIKKLRRVEKISDFSESAKKLIRSKKILRLIDNIHKKRNILFKDKLNFKYPKGGGYLPHIDGHFFWKNKNNKIENGWSKYSSKFINLVIPLENSNKSNGCLYVAKKKDTKKLGNTWIEVTKKLIKNTPNIKKKDLKKFIFFPIILNAGDILLFDWKCAHYSKENKSKKSRMIFYSTYCQKNKIIKNYNYRNNYYYDKEHSINSNLKKSLQ